MVMLYSPYAESYAARCSVSGTGLSFGIYDPSQSKPNDSTATVTVRCDTSGVPYSISLSAGINPMSSILNGRLMTGGSNTLTYNLFIDSTYTTIWGDGTTGAHISSITTMADTNSNFTIYGRIFAGQDMPAASYTDTIVITVFWP